MRGEKRYMFAFIQVLYKHCLSSIHRTLRLAWLGFLYRFRQCEGRGVNFESACAWYVQVLFVVDFRKGKGGR